MPIYPVVTVEDVGDRTFHLEHMSNFPDDDYCYLDIVVSFDDGETAKKRTVVFDYSSEFNELIQYVDGLGSIHYVRFLNGMLFSDKRAGRGACPCQLKNITV